MNNLAQGIIGAFEARTAGIAYLRGEVRERRQANQAQLREMARRQRGELAGGRAALQEMAGGYRQGTQVHLREIKAAVRERRRAAQTQLHELNQTHQSMSRQQRADLASGRTVLHRATQSQLRGLDRDHQAIAQRLREELERGPAELIQVERLRKSEVKTWLEDVAATHAGARAAWRDLVATMGAKRAGVVVAEAPPKVAPAPHAVAGVAPVQHTEEEAVERAQVGEVTTEFTFLSDRVFMYLANHPDGARLTEIEHEFGLGRFQAARAVRHLIDEGKAEKRDFCYFAI